MRMFRSIVLWLAVLILLYYIRCMFFIRFGKEINRKKCRTITEGTANWTIRATLSLSLFLFLSVGFYRHEFVRRCRLFQISAGKSIFLFIMTWIKVQLRTNWEMLHFCRAFLSSLPKILGMVYIGVSQSISSDSHAHTQTFLRTISSTRKENILNNSRCHAKWNFYTENIVRY